MKHINHLFSLLLAISLSVSAWGNTVTVYNPQPGEPYPTSTYLPIAINTGTGANNAYYSVSQQLYFASELTAASSTTINAITFYYSSGTSFTRSLEVWMNTTALTSFATPGGTTTPNMVAAGEKVFDGDVALTSGSPYTITFDTPYDDWDGESNIIVTVFDKTGKKNNIYEYEGYTIAPGQTEMFATPDKVRFLHKTNNTDKVNVGWSMDNLSAVTANSSSVSNRKYANKITFTFEGAAVAPETPDDLAVSATTATSATLAWSAVEGATSYDLQQSADGSVWSELSFGETGTSYNMTGLSVSSTLYVRIRATNSAGNSGWSSPITVTTDALHEHNGISFDKWAATNALPTSGNYYLNDDIAFGWENSDVTLTGDLNLCLNGKTADIFFLKIIVPAGKTLTIYDNVGGGKITGVVASEVGSNEDYNNALIVVKLSGTLVLKEGAIENNYIPDEDGSSYAIYSNGTLRMAGAPSISSKAVDIYLSAAGVITLDGALTNSEKYSVAKYAGSQITTGWGTHMSGEKPRDFFVSADDSHSVSLNAGGEAQLISAITLADNVDNSSTMSSKFGLTSNIIIGRSFSSASFNTICLPFDLSNAQLQDVFGATYNLQEFVGSDMDGETLMLNFSKVTALEAGKPYVIQPASNVSNPTFEGVQITETSPLSPLADANILFKGVLVPTSLTGGNKNLLFLGAGNELFWPESTDNLKSFRAYFEVLGGVALSPGRVRMAFNSEKAPQGLESIQDSAVRIQKILRDGKLIIIRDGREFNAQGILIR